MLASSHIHPLTHSHSHLHSHSHSHLHSQMRQSSGKQVVASMQAKKGYQSVVVGGKVQKVPIQVR